MAHGLTDVDGMFSVRETPWHGLGTILADLATAQEAIQAASLDWKVIKRPVFTQNPDGSFLKSDRFFATVREDTNETLGMVGPEYTPLQNKEAFTFFDKVCQDPNGPKYETAGSLHGGRKVWILARMPSFVEVAEHDIVKEYLLLSNTHDGSRKLEMRWTTVRVVCQNTLNLANSNGAAQVRFRHVPSIMDRVSDAQELLGIHRANHEILTQAIDYMKGIYPTDEQVEETLNALIIPSYGREHETPTVTKNKERIMDIFTGSETCNLSGIEGTSWSLLNAITEWSDHERPARPTVKDRASYRVESNWYGKSADFKQRAFDLVMGIK